MERAAIQWIRRGLIAIVGLAICVSHVVAGPFSNLVVFGDSLSDIGNIAQAPLINTPGPFYTNGRFSNGPVYAETLATGLGLPALVRSTVSGGTDYAYGGAQTTGTAFPNNLFVQDVDDQVGKYLSSHTANASTLYLIFAGANDLIDGQTNMSVPVGSLQSSMNRLITSGARQFLVVDLPPLGETPRYNGNASTRAQYDARAQQYNAALTTMVAAEHAANPTATLYQFDVYGLFEQVLARPSDFGLTNVTASAAPGLSPGDTSYDTSQIVSNPNQYLFWDDLHPTAAVHAILAQRMLDLFRLPGDFNGDGVVDAADYVSWRAGQSSAHIPDDYNVWAAHFGQIAADGAGLGAAVPEPATISICGLAFLSFFGMRRFGCAKLA
jgi:phospholipase/lecithinase/hemolysin